MENDSDFVPIDVNVGKLNIASLMGKRKIEAKKVKGIHTPAHELAVELAKYYDEPKKVGFWLGIIKRYGREAVRITWKGMADSRAPKSAGLLLFMLKKKKADYEKRSSNSNNGKVQGASDKPVS